MLKKTCKMACIGFLVGVVVGDVIAMLTGSSKTDGVTFASLQLLDMAGGNDVVAMTCRACFRDSTARCASPECRSMTSSACRWRRRPVFTVR